MIYFCLECETEITKDTEVCPTCNCSIDGFIDLEF
jgi:RNA polymerase subunit RPABC4/transcription elongation factor Spt4